MINPINSISAKKFGEIWQYPEFIEAYKTLTQKLNYVFLKPPKKLVRFFDDFNRDLKVCLESENRTRWLLRIQDYENRLRDMNLGLIKFCIREFLRNTKKDMVDSLRYKHD